MIPDSWERVNVDVKFDNCVFVTTLSEYVEKVNENNGVQEISYSPVRSTLGVPTKYSENSKIYVYDVEFEKCQFFMNSENYNEPMIYLYGFENDPSQNSSDKVSSYSFNKCLVAYRDGNGNPNDDAPKYDIYGNLINSMPRSYFIHPDIGTCASITNCSFYHNREVYPNDSVQGFVKRSFLEHYFTCKVDDLTRYNQKLDKDDNSAS